MQRRLLTLISFFFFINVRPGDLIEGVLKPKDSFVYPTLREMPISNPSFSDDFIRLIVETKVHFEFNFQLDAGLPLYSQKLPCFKLPTFDLLYGIKEQTTEKKLELIMLFSLAGSSNIVA